LPIVDCRCEIDLIEVNVFGRAARNLKCIDNTRSHCQPIHTWLAHCTADIDDDSGGGCGG
jgi:hypothetical protein